MTTLNLERIENAIQLSRQLVNKKIKHEEEKKEDQSSGQQSYLL